MTFLDDESSAENNRPLELYVVEFPTDVYYFVSGNRDYTEGAIIYKAIPIARTEVAQPGPNNQADVAISLPVNHPIVTRYLNQGIPPRYIQAVIYRKQIRSGITERIWGGRVTSMAIEDRVAKLRVPSRASELMLRTIPQITRGKLCPHILYDTMCRISRSSYVVSTTVLFVSGRKVRVDMGDLAKGGAWAESGELVHVASGERMTIANQADLNPGVSSVTELTMQMQIPGMANGDAVEVYAGCDHTINTCHFKFDNRYNFGGLHTLNTRGAINYVWHVSVEE